MKFKDDYGKDMLILDKENLTYKSSFIKIVIKRSDIRSVFYDENTLGILTYSGKIYRLVITKLLFSERKRLEELRLELSKENILFDYNNCMSSYMVILYISWANVILNSNIFNGYYNILYKLILTVIIVSLIILIKKRNKTIIYNIDKEEFEIFTFKNIIKYKKHEVDKIKVKKVNDTINAIVFKKNKNNFRLNFRGNPYLTKIYNTSLTKLFN